MSRPQQLLSWRNKVQQGTHIPGAHREEKRREARYSGVKIPADLHQQLTTLAGGKEAKYKVLTHNI